MTKKRKRKPAAPSTKSTSARILLVPDQLATWHRAAEISHEGNLSMFIRTAGDRLAAEVIKKAEG